MRVAELATELGVSSEVLLSLLRTLRISVTDKDASVSDGDVALILARLERERRSGHKGSAEAIEAAIVDAKPIAGKRRRRRMTELPPEPDPQSEMGVAEGVDAAEEMDAAEETEVAASDVDSDEDSAGVLEPAPDTGPPVDVMDVVDEVVPELDIVADSEPTPEDPEEPGPQGEDESQVEAETEA